MATTNTAVQISVYQREDDESVTQSIIGAFEMLGVDTFAKEKPLYDFIDTNALNRIFGKNAGDVAVEVAVWGYTIRVTESEIEVQDEIGT